jgi:hypothetical protein
MPHEGNEGGTVYTQDFNPVSDSLGLTDGHARPLGGGRRLGHVVERAVRRAAGHGRE